MKEIEAELTARYGLVCGVDEAGRGPLAGPVYAAAVLLRPGQRFDGLDDSKKLTEKKRESLYVHVTAEALGWSVAYATAEEIDELNILNATYLAMNRAIEGLSPAPSFALIDGNRSEGILLPNRTVVGGDGVYEAIAAASVLAKVTRDRFMLEMAEKYPEYAFEKHKGYGTKLHYERLREYGPSPIHRRSFLKKLH